MPSDWTYSNWITFATGTAARLDTLRLHIKEVSDKISQGSYSSEGKSHDFDYLQAYLKDLLALEKEEAATSAASSSTGNRAFFTRGRML